MESEVYIYCDMSFWMIRIYCFLSTIYHVYELLKLLSCHLLMPYSHLPLSFFCCLPMICSSCLIPLLKDPKFILTFTLSFLKDPKFRNRNHSDQNSEMGTSFNLYTSRQLDLLPPCVTTRGRHRRRNLALLPPLSPLPPPHRWKAGRRSNMVVVGPNCGGSRRGAE